MEVYKLPNQEIQCKVINCRHNNKNNFCTLPNIEVGESNFEARHKKDTECNNFEPEI